MSDVLARSDDFVVHRWSKGVLLLREGDDLNEAQGFVISPEELRWLVLVGGPAAMHEVEGAIPKISDRANRRCANG